MALNDDVIVEVFEGKPVERSGSFKNDNGEQVEYSTRKQEGKLEARGFAYPYEIRLEKDQAPFAPGRYRMNVAKMLTVNKGAHNIGKYAVLEPLAGK